MSYWIMTRQCTMLKYVDYTDFLNIQHFENILVSTQFSPNSPLHFPFCEHFLSGSNY